MQFKQERAIYQQIADAFMDRLLEETAPPPGTEWRFPSIRETADDFGVNPNTVARTYIFLEEQGVIYSRRGIGYFICPDAQGKIREWKKQTFLKDTLPEFFRNLDLLGLTLEDLKREYTAYIKEVKK